MTGYPTGPNRCRECTAVFDADGSVDHDPTCPRRLDQEATDADDARWFREHPGQAVRRRPLAWAEKGSLADYNMLLEYYAVPGMVSVRRVAPGVLNYTLDAFWAIRKGGAV